MNASVVGRRRAQSLQVLSAHMDLLPVHTAQQMLLHTFPETLRGVVQSELNYSVILSCLTTLRPTPVIHWTFNGQPRGTGEKLIIRQLSREDLGTYMCVAKNSQEQHSSELVKVSLAGKPPSPTPNPCTLAGRWPVFLAPLNPLL